MAKLSAFDDKKSSRKKKRKPKRNLTKASVGITKDSTPKSVLHISDVDYSEGSSKSDASGLDSELPSQEPSTSRTILVPTTAEKFLNFLRQ